LGGGEVSGRAAGKFEGVGLIIEEDRAAFVVEKSVGAVLGAK
jgi:hypothetical protein